MIYSFNTELAEKYGDRAAYFLGYLQHVITNNKANERNFHAGRTWSYNSMESFAKVYSWLNSRQIRHIIDKLIKDNVILKCKAYADLGARENNQTNAYAFVNEKDWLNIDTNSSDKNVKRNKEKDNRLTNSSDKNVDPFDKIVQPSDKNVKPINSYLNINKTFKESTRTHAYDDKLINNKDEIQKLWIRTWGRNPKNPEYEETVKLIKKFGEEKVYNLMKQSALKNFRNFYNFLQSIDDDGNLLGIEEKKRTEKIYTYEEVLKITQNKTGYGESGKFEDFEHFKENDKTYWRRK